MSTTTFAVLGLLSIEPMSGYDIRRNLDESLSHFWSESFGQIYPTLKRLEADRLVAPVKEASPARRRKLYTLTPAGRARLRSWLAEAPRAQPPRSELLLKLFFGRQASPGICAAHLRRMRVQQEQLIATLTAIERELRLRRPIDPNLRYRLITLHAGIARGQALLDWSEEALGALGTTS